MEIKSHFFDLSLDLLCILDQHGNFQAINRAFRTQLNAPPIDFASLSFMDFVHPHDCQSVAPIFIAPLIPATPQSFVCRHVCYDDSIKWVLWTLYPETPDVLYGVGRDITSYKQMESKEQERNVFSEALLDTVLAINSSLALDQVLDRILSNIGKVVAYQHVSILLVESDRAELVGTHNAAQNRHDLSKIIGRTFAIAENHYLHHMFQTRESLIIPEIDQTPAWIAVEDSVRLGAFLGAPIVVEDEVIGFLCVFNTHKEFFTLLHAQQLITFANQAGIAINNARLYEQAQSAAILRERQRMAQELHDSVNQDLFAASTYADLLPKALTRKPQVVAQYAQDISKLIRGAVEQMRMILIELHPDTLTTTGLEVLIRQLANVFSRQTGLPLKLNISNTKIVLEEKVQIAVYRIAQEALHNIEKHANASQINVTLHLSERELHLTLEDDGRGFDQQLITEVQFGISGMQERATSIDADLSIESVVGQGTKINLRKIYHDRNKPYSHYSGGRP